MTPWRLGAEIFVTRVGASTVVAAAALLVVGAAGVAHLVQLRSSAERMKVEIAALRAQVAAP